MMHERQELVWLSKAVGQRFDMVQAGGGNTSVKCSDGKMLIKASGIGLSEVECDKGISVVVDGVALDGIRPSMEVGMHVLLDTWVLHAHPLVVGMVVCRSDWHDVLKRLFPNVLLVDYFPPGVELASALERKKSETTCLPEIIFLQNHGLVVHGQTADWVLKVTETVLARLEDFCGVDFSCYKQTTVISQMVKRLVPLFMGAAYLSEDTVIQSVLRGDRQLLDIRPCFPDSFIYGGYEVVSAAHIKEYSKKYKTYPRIVVYQDNVFFLANSVRKAQEAEAVFKAQLLISVHGKKQLQSLPLDDLEFLAAMSSEQYRQNC